MRWAWRRTPRGSRGLARALLSGCAAVALSACTSSKSELFVFGASSLTEAFQALEQQFEEAHPQVDVVLNLAGSQTLRVQIEHGAPADVFASATPEHVERLRALGLLEAPQELAQNTLTVVVPKNNPAGLERFEDLPNASRIVLGLPQVPIGAYTQMLFKNAERKWGPRFSQKIQSKVVSRETNARLVLTKIALGEADAAVVYTSDAIAKKLPRISIPEELVPSARYMIARTPRAPSTADEWITMARSAKVQSQLRALGFGSTR